MAPVEDNNEDSGMESQEASQSDNTATNAESNPKVTASEEPVKDDSEIEEIVKYEGETFDDEPDETLSERLWGLTEMFPEKVRCATQCFVDGTQTGVSTLYSFSRSALWVVFSTSIILFAPVIFEVERAQMEEMQRNQQKQMLLGPNTAVSGSGSMPPLMPPIQQR